MNNKLPFSKKITKLIFWGGIIIIQECIALIAFAIYKDFTATAAYLTAAIGVAEAMIMIVANKYLNMATIEHSAGGITYDSLKNKNFEEI